METLQIPVEKQLKEKADRLFSSLGMDTSTAVKIFLIVAIENDGIPFAVQHREDSLAEAIEDARLNRNLAGPFDSAEEAVTSMLID